MRGPRSGKGSRWLAVMVRWCGDRTPADAPHVCPDPYPQRAGHAATGHRQDLFKGVLGLLGLLWLICAVGMGGSAAWAASDRRSPRRGGTAGSLVARWVSRGTAAGNRGDYYDNRDRGHSLLRTSDFPGLRAVQYTAGQKKEQLDWGGQTAILDHVVIGNSSTSSDVRRGGSNVRAMYYLSADGMQFLYTQYRSNNLYVYPEHRDHDPGHNGQGGYGDLFPTNSPYVMISQGSSASDMPFVRAFVRTLAAFRPNVKKRLIATGLLMPTLQMIFRSSYKRVTGRHGYLTGRAHPTVFDPKHVDAIKMVRAAHAMRVETIPPIVGLKVLEEGSASDSNPYFHTQGSERLADTPAVIARVFHGAAYWQRMVVTAGDSRDLHRRPLNYHWVVLRGDRSRIKIQPRQGGAVAEVLVAYHPRRPIARNAPMSSNRVDIGVFVEADGVYSAPGFITFYGLDNQLRTYDRHRRIVEVHYQARDQHLKIVDWQALLEVVTGDPKRLPVRLFQEALGPKQLAAIAKWSVTLKPVLTKLDRAKSSQIKARARHANAKTSLKTRQRELEQARAVRRQNSEGHANAVWSRAKAELDTAIEQEANARKAVKRTGRTIQSALRSVEEAVTTKRAEFGGRSLQQQIYRALNAIRRDTDFYVNHAVLLPRRSSDPKTSPCYTAREKLIELKIFEKQDHGRFALRRKPATESGSVKPRFTEYERYQITRFHGLVLAEWLYPEFLAVNETTNFVDHRLARSKPFRDIFHYDHDGRPTGRTRRYDNGRTVETGAGAKHPAGSTTNSDR